MSDQLVPTCAYVLDNGHPCQAPSRRGEPFCRHHDPEALARRRHAVEPAGASATPAQRTRTSQPSAESDELNPWTLRAYWRVHHQLIPACGPEDLDAAFTMILEALANRQIAPRSAGRLILAILDRRRQLAEETHVAPPTPGACALQTASGIPVEALD